LKLYGTAYNYIFTQVLHMVVCTKWCSCLEEHYAKLDTAVLTEEYFKFPLTLPFYTHVFNYREFWMLTCITTDMRTFCYFSKGKA